MTTSLLTYSKRGEDRFNKEVAGLSFVRMQKTVFVDYLQKSHIINDESLGKVLTKSYEDQTPRKTDEKGLVSSG